MTLTVHSCMFMQLHREKNVSNSLHFLSFISISCPRSKQRGMAPTPSRFQARSRSSPAVTEAVLPLPLYCVINIERGRTQLLLDQARTPNSAAKTLAVHAGQRPIHVSKSVDRIDDRLLPLPYPELTSYKSGLGFVSRASPVHTAVRNCTRDEGGPFEVGNQVLISSHRKLLSLKATVVNVAEKSEQDSGRHG